MTANPEKTTSLSSTIRQVILAAFAADSLSLGPHWEYNTDRIASHYHGKVDHLSAPISSYHPNKTTGDQTHIGDQALLLLESLATLPSHSFDLQSFLLLFQSKWDTPSPPGYLDHATKHLLQQLKSGKPIEGSTDDDLSHSSKFFPLLAVYHDEESLVKATRQLMSAFQSGEKELTTGEFLARVAFRVIFGKQKPSVAMESVVSEVKNEWLTERVRLGKASVSLSDVEAVRSFGEKKESAERTFYTGLSCSVNFGLPSVVHYVYKYEDVSDPTVAIVEDVSVGGNSNARSIATAVLLFGYRGIAGFKINDLIAGIKQRPHIEALLDKIEAERK